MRKVFGLVAIASFIALFLLQAQSVSAAVGYFLQGQITRRVTTGSPIFTVEAITSTQGTRVTRYTTTSNVAGQYVFYTLPKGPYVVRIINLETDKKSVPPFIPVKLNTDTSGIDFTIEQK